MPKSATELLEDARPQTDEELGTELPASEESNISQFVKPKKKKPPSRTTKMEKEATQSDDENEETEKTLDKEKETEDFVIEKIVNNQVNKSRNHKYAEYGEPLYYIRWYGVVKSAL